MLSKIRTKRIELLQEQMALQEQEKADLAALAGIQEKLTSGGNFVAYNAVRDFYAKGFSRIFNATSLLESLDGE